MLKTILKYLILFIFISFFQGCLENPSISVPNFTGVSSEEMVTYFETHGDIINNISVPWLISAQTVSDSLENFLLIDTRPPAMFAEGHISQAKNVQSYELLNFIKTADVKKYPKVVIISATGQASAYYASLLRLAGSDNIYSMSYGMASWNNKFAKLWLNSCKDSPFIKQYTNVPGTINQAANFPEINFKTKSDNVKDKIEERINELLLAGFNDYDSVITDNEMLPGPTVDSRRLITEVPSLASYYLVCYGNDNLYTVTELFNPYRGLGHPNGSVLYSPASSLHGSEYLMTFPANKEIIIYCYNGQLSAAATAYLRLLGFNARSMLFGAHSLFYDRLKNYSPSLNRFIFTSSDIRDFPYITGK